MKRAIYISLLTITLLSCDSAVKICDQTWMIKNLDVNTYRNGDIIPQVTDARQWQQLTTGAWCYYNNDPSMEINYGKIYNWYAVHDPRGLAPAGWHIPTDAEWTTLFNCLGSETVAGGKMKSTSTLWNPPNTGATNSSGFSAIPGGARGIDGYDHFTGIYAFWWSATAFDQADAGVVELKYNLTSSTRFNFHKFVGYSVRCIKD